MKAHLHKRKLNECSIGLLIYYFRQNELASIFPWYILILIAASTLPLATSVPLSRTSTVLLSFSSFFGKATLPFLARLCLTSAHQSVDQLTHQFTPKPLLPSDEKQLTNLPDFRLNHNDTGNDRSHKPIQPANHDHHKRAESIVHPNDLREDSLRNSKDSPNFQKSDQKIIITKESVFPCLDSLEVSLFNLSEPLGDYHHLIRVYHSNALNKQTNSASDASGQKNVSFQDDRFGPTKYGQEENQLTYVKEFIVNRPLLINAKYSIHCGLFDPVYLLYCFRYVSINQTNGQIRFENKDLYCLPTLLATLRQANRNADYRREQKRKGSRQNAELARFNSVNYSGGYGSSLRLYEEADELASERRAFNLNKANQHTQTKYVVCSCGKKSSLKVHQTNYRIRLTSGNGYCGGQRAAVEAGEEEATSKSLIKIRKLNFEFCFIDLTLPTWIEIKVKDVLLIDKKDQDLKQLASNNLIIRDGQTCISPQLNYLHSFPTFHYISSGLLRFESNSLGNQYTIELNQLGDQIDLSTRKSKLATDEDENAFERPEKKKPKETKSEAYNRGRFMSERQTKLNHTERTLRSRPDQDSFKAKLDQALNLKHLSSIDKPRTNKKADLKDESLFVLLIGRNGQNRLIDGLNQNRVLSEIRELNSSSYERLLDDELNATVERQDRARRLALNLIVLLAFILISTSVSVFIWIFTRTKAEQSTGNLICFGLPDEHFLQNTYQEVQSASSNKSSIRSKSVRIDEQRIYESCRTNASTSDQEESDSPNDLLRDTEDGSETENELNNELNNLTKSVPGSEELSNSETLKNETSLYKSSFKDDFHELNKKRKMFKNCFNSCGSKDDVSNEAVGSRLSQCSFPTSEISLELDYYDYVTPFVPKTPFVTTTNGNNL